MSSLTGQLLIAMPQMDDPFFARSVVYLCSHSPDDGAMGLVINKTIDSLTIDELFARLSIAWAARPGRPQAVHFGGPVATGQGFVLHSADYHEEETVEFSDGFAMTATREILLAQGQGTGPRQSLLALGYAGWAPGQLEAEIQRNGWLLVAADTGLVFESDDDSKWSRALGKLGVSPEMLSGDSGRA